MPNVRNYPVGTIGWTGSTMRENLQEDVFIPCDMRLVAVNVGPDGTYGSLVYDTNQNNEYDPERSAYLQSAFRVIKRPLGSPNAIGFQLNLAGNKDTKGGYFVDLGDASVTTQSVATGTVATGGSGMVSVAGQGQDVISPVSGGGDAIIQTAGAGQNSGVLIGQGSYMDGGPFHVGNKNDKHRAGVDADGNPINCLHLWTSSNFYRNSVEDGPLRFEKTYKIGTDQAIVVPVHLAWTGFDWAWWSTSFLYSPYEPTKPTKPGVPTVPNDPARPGVPTPGNPGIPSSPSVPTVGTPTTTGTLGGTGGGIGNGGTPSGGSSDRWDSYDEAGTGDDRTPGPDGSVIDTDTGMPYGATPKPATPPAPGPAGGGPTPAGGSVKPFDPNPKEPPKPPGFDLPFDPTTGGFLNITDGSQSGALFNIISVAGVINSTAQTFQAQSYVQGAINGGTFGAPTSSAISKTAATSPMVGAASTFAAQGGAIAGGTTASGVSFPASTTGAQGDPWSYKRTPRGQSFGGAPMSRYKPGTADGGIVYHPIETDLRDAQKNGMAPSGVTLNTFRVITAPGAYFGCGVPELTNGSIKSGFDWGVDSTNGDLVFRSISSSQSPIEAMRIGNTSQRISFASGMGSNGTLAHFNTAARTWTFQDVSGYVLLNAGNIGFYGTTPRGQLTITGAKGGNVALANLLTALSQYGLIIDNTT